MLAWIRQLDELLRGRRTAPELLVEGRVELLLAVFVPLAILLGAIYGFFMGWYGVLSRPEPTYMPLVASAVKLPALFLLTLIVTFPSLYVFNTIVGCRLGFAASVRLLVGAIAVNVAVAASLGPILGFFTVSTKDYSFMILLNVVLLAVAGFVGLGFLLQTLRRLAGAEAEAASRGRVADAGAGPGDTAAGPKPSGREPGPLDSMPGRYSAEAARPGRTIFYVWVIIYGLVGAQMGWLLRPFIGSPDLPFAWFRARQGNFFLAMLQLLGGLGK